MFDLFIRKNILSEHDNRSSGSDYTMPLNSTTEELVLLSKTTDFIGCWLQALEHNFLDRCNMYFVAMKNMFQEILVELPKPPTPKEKHQSLLHAIGGGWYMEN